MLFIGICGASGSGKSTLAEGLQQELGDRCLVLQQDAYYLDHPDMTFEQRVKLNYDEPTIFDHDLLLQDVQTLMAGQPITRKHYDYARHRRDDLDVLLYPRDVVILEGIHTFSDARLRELMFLKLYVKLDPDICLLRRIRRDIKERGRDIDGIITQYLTTVKPMYEQYIKHYAADADIIVSGDDSKHRIIDLLVGYVQDALGAS